MINNRSLLEPRANLLLGHLETRYLNFIESLPNSMQITAHAKATYLGGDSQESFSGLKELNPLITQIPWLFWEISRELGDEIFLIVAEAGACTALASVLMDHLSDSQLPEPGPQILFREAVHDHAAALYRYIFSSESNFWRQYDRYSREHIACLEADHESRTNLDLLTYENFIEIASGKVAPMLITIAAFREILDIEDSFQPIQDSIRNTSIAGQMHDDILDWESDLDERHLTYFLHTMAGEGSFKGGAWPEGDHLSRINNKEWSDVNSLNLTIEWFDKAIHAVQSIPCAGWINYLREYRAVAEKHKQAALKRHLIRILAEG